MAPTNELQPNRGQPLIGDLDIGEVLAGVEPASQMELNLTGFWWAPFGREANRKRLPRGALLWMEELPKKP